MMSTRLRLSRQSLYISISMKLLEESTVIFSQHKISCPREGKTFYFINTFGEKVKLPEIESRTILAQWMEDGRFMLRVDSKS